eukprot:gene10722-biopygen16810
MTQTSHQWPRAGHDCWGTHLGTVPGRCPKNFPCSLGRHCSPPPHVCGKVAAFSPRRTVLSPTACDKGGAPWCSVVLRGAPECSRVLRGAPWRSVLLRDTPGCSAAPGCSTLLLPALCCHLLGRVPGVSRTIEIEDTGVSQMRPGHVLCRFCLDAQGCSALLPVAVWDTQTTST